MTRIGPVEQIVFLLRERLDRAGRTPAGRPEQSEPLGTQARLAALGGIRDLPPRSFRRAMVRGLIAERIGESLAGDPAFEDLVGRIIDLLEDNPETAGLLDRAAASLRGDA